MISSTDHLSLKTGAAPVVNLSKAGAAFAAAGGTVTEVANGWYKVALTTTDTNTLGDLAYYITGTGADDTDFADQVVANILGDTLPANVTQWSGGAVPAPNITGEPLVDVNHWRGAQPSTLNSGSVQADVERWINGAPPTPITTGVPIVDWIPSGWRQNTAQAGAAGSITLDAGASATDSFYKFALIALIGGTGAGQARLCTAYTGSTKVATIAPNWTTNPDATSKFSVLPIGLADVETWLASAVGAATAGTPDVNVKNYNNVAAQTDANNLPKVDVEDWKAGVVPAVNVTGVPKVDLIDWLGSAPNALQSGMVQCLPVLVRAATAQAGSATTITLDAGASGTTDYYRGQVIALMSGTGGGQSRICTAYNSATKVATVDRTWATNPDATTVFALLGITDILLGADGKILISSDAQDLSASLSVNAKAIAGVAAALDSNNFLKVDAEDWKGTAVTTPATAGIPDVNVKNYNNHLAITDTNNVPTVDAGYWNGGAITGSLPSNFALFAIDASGRVDVGKVSGTVQTARDIGNDSKNLAAAFLIRSATAQAGTSSSITLDSGANGTTGDFYKGLMIVLISGTGAGQAQVCTAYNATTKVASVLNWPTVPDATTVFQIVAAGTVMTGYSGQLSGTATVSSSIQSDVQTAIGLTIALDGSGRVDVGNWRSSIPNALIGGRIDANAQVVGDKTGYALTSAERNAVADAFLARTLGTEGYAAKGAVPTVAQALFMLLQNMQEMAISGTTVNIKKLDGSTIAMTLTLDSSSTPTSRTRTT